MKSWKTPCIATISEDKLKKLVVLGACSDLCDKSHNGGSRAPGRPG